MCGKAPMIMDAYLSDLFYYGPPVTYDKPKHSGSQQVSWTHTMAGNAMLAVLMDRRKERFTRDLLAGKVFESVRALC